MLHNISESLECRIEIPYPLTRPYGGERLGGRGGAHPKLTFSDQNPQKESNNQWNCFGIDFFVLLIIMTLVSENGIFPCNFKKAHQICSWQFLQFPVWLIRGRNLDFSRCTIPTVCRYEKYGVFPQKSSHTISETEAEGILLLFLILVTVLQVTRDVTQVS